MTLREQIIARARQEMGTPFVHQARLSGIGCDCIGLLIIIGRALNMLKSQIEAQGKAFEESGGFSERLMTKRLEAREGQKNTGPECPVCSKPMRQRKSAKGDFWGCSAFPDCKGTRPV